MDPIRFVRAGVAAMTGYAPGEQPTPMRHLIKLNTNENPQEPPPRVKKALEEGMAKIDLRRYPDPSASRVREVACRVYGHGLTPGQVVVGNGSDDLLTMIMRTFVEPGECVAAPGPTYTLYEVLAHLQGGRYLEVPWKGDGGLPVAELADLPAKVVFVVRPNAPTGHVVALGDVARLCREFKGMVVLDEAYVDFADAHGLGLLQEYPNLVIIRTFSKSMAMAALRIGLGFMDSRLALEFHKVRDSYNINAFSQLAARVALEHHADYQPIWSEIRIQRQRLTQALRQRGFAVPDSQANFILAQVPVRGPDAAWWLTQLQDRDIHVRYFPKDPRLSDKLRITIGRGVEMDRFLAVVDEILSGSMG
ncbi:MAG: histidinol phosphate aminotransferase apoenzyme [Magnetococcales bacterium]|nr:histidinol phosphate aminotransferase apoenzyme [Magnetococcales bacterium]HIJ84404.1 histidinol-phosphate transaminase [Magnetococcales bacterium]